MGDRLDAIRNKEETLAWIAQVKRLIRLYSQVTTTLENQRTPIQSLASLRGEGRPKAG